MMIHEYQAKSLLAQYGLPVPIGSVALEPGAVARAAQEVMAASREETLVVKAQIHAGGRGKAGGVKVVQGGARPARPGWPCSGAPWSPPRPGPGAGW